MSSADVAGVITFVVGTAVFATVLALGWRRVQSTYSKAIVRRLKEGGQAVEMQVSDRRGTWNPATREVAGRIFANGRARYVLDDTGVVHLDFYPATGGERHYHGPVPAWHESAAGRRRRKVARRVFVAYCAWSALGFALGFSLAHGSAARRVVLGLVGLLCAMVSGSGVATFVRARAAIRARPSREPAS